MWVTHYWHLAACSCFSSMPMKPCPWQEADAGMGIFRPLPDFRYLKPGKTWPLIMQFSCFDIISCLLIVSYCSPVSPGGEPCPRLQCQCLQCALGCAHQTRALRGGGEAPTRGQTKCDGHRVCGGGECCHLGHQRCHTKGASEGTVK